MKKLIATLVISTAAVSGVALADYNCEQTKANWQSEQALRDAVQARGWEITSFEIDDGCYEIHGYDNKQRRVEASFDPATLELVEMELEN